MEQYSVLMSVYYKANPDFFDEAIQSVLAQTYATNDFVIVCDGPLTKQLDAVIDTYVALHPDVFHIIKLPQNVGIGAAAEAGLRACKNDLVAKMDADDISLPNRCQKQVERFHKDRDLAMVGGFIEEFESDPDNPFSVREVPLSNDEIREFAKRRQPFNNISIMYRRNAVLAVGGYRKLRRSEDYDLYIRLLHKGYKGENLQEILAKCRVDSEARKRRTSLQTLMGFVHSRWNAFRIGYSSVWDFTYCCCGELFVFFCPPKLQDKIYMRFLRKNIEVE